MGTIAFSSSGEYLEDSGGPKDVSFFSISTIATIESGLRRRFDSRKKPCRSFFENP